MRKSIVGMPRPIMAMRAKSPAMSMSAAIGPPCHCLVPDARSNSDRHGSLISTVPTLASWPTSSMRRNSWNGPPARRSLRIVSMSCAIRSRLHDYFAVHLPVVEGPHGLRALGYREALRVQHRLEAAGLHEIKEGVHVVARPAIR